MATQKVTREQLFMNKVGDVLIAVDQLNRFAETFPAGKKALAAALDHIEQKRKKQCDSNISTTKPSKTSPRPSKRSTAA